MPKVFTSRDNGGSILTLAEERWLCLKDVAKLLQCSERTVQRMVHRGDFPRPKAFAPRVVRWRLSDVVGRDFSAISKTKN